MLPSQSWPALLQKNIHHKGKQQEIQLAKFGEKGGGRKHLGS